VRSASCPALKSATEPSRRRYVILEGAAAAAGKAHEEQARSTARASRCPEQLRAKVMATAFAKSYLVDLEVGLRLERGCALTC
jgi:hypothetical protein